MCFHRELNLKSTQERPTIDDIEAVFGGAKKIALIGSLVLTVLLIFIWPGIVAALGVFTYSHFTVWVIIAVVWAAVATIYIIISPLVSEVRFTMNAYSESKKNAVEPMNRDRDA